MTTFAEKSIRVFTTQSDEDLSRLRRKRSSGRLKSFASNTDNRAWGCVEGDRRRHILELLKSYGASGTGNFIPIDIIFAVLLQIANQEKSRMLGSSLDLDRKLELARRKQRELEGQKKELSSLATCLSRAGGDLRKENLCMKNEIERLKKILSELEAKAKACEEESIKLKKELDKWMPQDENERAMGRKGFVDMLKNERDHLRNELDNLRNVQNQLKEAEQRITELLCEIESLQKCLEKAECDALQMVQIIEKQQVKINSLQMCECKLKDITKQRDFLKKQLDCVDSRESDTMNSFMPNNCPAEDDNGSLASLECQKRQIEMERDQLKCQLQMIEEEMRLKDKDISRLNRKLCKQNECISSLKEMLATAEKDPCADPCAGGMLRVENSSSDTYCKDLEEMQCKMKELHNKVGQQAQIIMSQRKCLLEQHKYILEQEQVRTNIQNRIREQARKQAELIYERNLLRNEIVFLTARLKTYLGKIQLLEKSIGQLFDTTKSGKYNEECLDPSSFISNKKNSKKTMRPTSMKSQSGYGNLGRGKLSSLGCSRSSSNPVDRFKKAGKFKNQFPSNKSGCPDLSESLSNDNFRTFMMPSSSSNDMNCLPPDDKSTKNSKFMTEEMGVDSLSSMSFSAENCLEKELCNDQLPMCPSDDQFDSPMGNMEQESYTGNGNYLNNANTMLSQISSRFRSSNSSKRNQGKFTSCMPCSG